ncbi:hypothetical protein C8Q78DRAFT_1141427 [Trametes maxima]|nr:hypothetical protein C8Q78DRAFT_1141427 [Trametes maxima]
MFIPVFSYLGQRLYPRLGGGGGSGGGGGGRGGSAGSGGSKGGSTGSTGSSGSKGGSTGSSGSKGGSSGSSSGGSRGGSGGFGSGNQGGSSGSSTGSGGSRGGSSGFGSGSTGSSSGSTSGNGGSRGSGGFSGPNVGRPGGGAGGSLIPISGSTVGRTGAVSYGPGTTKVITIPAGQPFAGRSSGGATRGQIYGTRTYGSGYPGYLGLGVAGLAFPFVFWPLVWGDNYGYGPPYLNASHEYGQPNNSSRPGGPLVQAGFTSNTTNTTFHVVSDNSTVTALIASIKTNCTLASNSSNTPLSFSGSASNPKPEQAVQYYRASSVVLTLDGYNDTSALTNDSNAPPIPLPSNIDTSLLNCLNDTIGAAVPLFDDFLDDGTSQDTSAGQRLGLPHASGVIGLGYLVWCLSHYL